MSWRQIVPSFGAKFTRLTNNHSVKRSHSVLRTNSLPIEEHFYCKDLVRKHDFENYLSTLLIGNMDHQRAVFAIRGFNTELALIRDQVTHKETGAGRFVFWKDAVRLLFKAKLNNDFKGLPKHPVITNLSKNAMQADVHEKWFMNLVESREEGLADVQYDTLEDLEAYTEKSVTSIFYLILSILNIKDLTVDHTCSHLGRAIGLTNFIRAIHYNAQRRRVLIPRELLVDHKLSQESFIRVKDSEIHKIQALVFELSSQALKHYEIAQSHESDIKHLYKTGRLEHNPLLYFNCAIPSRIYLERLEKYHFNPYHSRLTERYHLLAMHLLVSKLLRRYY